MGKVQYPGAGNGGGCLLKGVYGRAFIFLVGCLFVFGSSCSAKASSDFSVPSDESVFLLAAVESHELQMNARKEAWQGEPGTTGRVSPINLSQKQDPRGDSDASLQDSDPFDDPWEDEPGGIDTIPDPLEPMNRFFFQFNDKVYFWVFKPVGTGYSKVVPLTARLSIRNFFTNLLMPIRAVSCLLQGKFEGLGIEVVRFVVNSTAGFLGFQDVAKQALDFPIQDEDLGQAFAFYGIGPGCYLNLPFLGAFSLRDAVGWVGGLFLNPLDYMIDHFWGNVGYRSFDLLNKTSLRIGEYEALKKASLDPYVAMRDAYYQYRLNQIEK